MVVHRWTANKSCPGNYLYSKHVDIAAQVNALLRGENTTTTKQEDDDMDVKRFKELWSEMRRELQDNDKSAYSEEARNWATPSGLIAGSGNTTNGDPNYMWEDILTREQFVTVLYRFAKMMGKA